MVHAIFPGFAIAPGSILMERHRRKKAMASNLNLGHCSGRKNVSLTEINIKNQHISYHIILPLRLCGESAQKKFNNPF